MYIRKETLKRKRYHLIRKPEVKCRLALHIPDSLHGPKSQKRPTRSLTSIELSSPRHHPIARCRRPCLAAGPREADTHSGHRTSPTAVAARRRSAGRSSPRSRHRCCCCSSQHCCLFAPRHREALARCCSRCCCCCCSTAARCL
jgi:hypothetical protein